MDLELGWCGKIDGRVFGRSPTPLSTERPLILSDDGQCPASKPFCMCNPIFDACPRDRSFRLPEIRVQSLQARRLVKFGDDGKNTSHETDSLRCFWLDGFLQCLCRLVLGGEDGCEGLVKQPRFERMFSGAIRLRQQLARIKVF